MDRRFITFLALSTVVVIMNFTIMWWLQKNQPPAPRKKAGQQVAAKGDKKADKKGELKPKANAEKPDAKPDGEKPDAEKEAAKELAAKELEAKEFARQEPALEFYSLGSVDPSDPYRMLATITNRGAAVERIELSSRRFHDLEDRSGYL